MRRVYFLKPLSSKSLFFGTDHTSRKEKKTVYIVIVYYSFFFFCLCQITSQLFIRGLLRSHVPTLTKRFSLTCPIKEPKYSRQKRACAHTHTYTRL